jgi:hypothetical protein
MTFKSPEFLRNRTTIGIISLFVAIIVGFVLFPLVNNLSNSSTYIIRAKVDIPVGTQITSSMLERVSVGHKNLPTAVETNAAAVVGKYSSVEMIPQEMITSTELSTTGGIYNLTEGQYLM